MHDAPHSLPEPDVHSVETPDGWVIRVYDYRPAHTPRAVVVAGHAMMVDSRTLARPDRPTITAQLVQQGMRVLVPDLRGHGHSGPLAGQGADWSYDELVEDVGVLVKLAYSLEPERPLALLGHSLFGHCALAWLNAHPQAPVRCLVLVAVEVWNRNHETAWYRWLIKRALYLFTMVIVGVVGHFPARRLRQGSNDEAPSYWRQFNRMQQVRRWCTADLSRDFDDKLEDVSQAVLHVVSEGDWLYANPRSALKFTDRLPSRDALVCGRDDAPGALHALSPSHMGVVTDPQSQPLWRHIGRWILRQTAEG